jgi:hypothetical protein
MASDATPNTGEPLGCPSWVSAKLAVAARDLWHDEFGETLTDADLKELLMNVEGLFTVLFDDGGIDEDD